MKSLRSKLHVSRVQKLREVHGTTAQTTTSLAKSSKLRLCGARLSVASGCPRPKLWCVPAFRLRSLDDTDICMPENTAYVAAAARVADALTQDVFMAPLGRRSFPYRIRYEPSPVQSRATGFGACWRMKLALERLSRLV